MSILHLFTPSTESVSSFPRGTRLLLINFMYPNFGNGLPIFEQSLSWITLLLNQVEFLTFGIYTLIMLLLLELTENCNLVSSVPFRSPLLWVSLVFLLPELLRWFSSFC